MKIHPVLLAPLVAIAFFAVIVVGQRWELPTMRHQFSESSSQSQDVEMIVDGLRCRGTSNFFVKRLEATPGLLGVATYVQEHRATITYDPGRVALQRIREIIEEPVTLRDGRIVQPFRVREIRE